MLEGTTAPGWEPVAEVLERVIMDDGGAGSAVCVYLDGVPVVDVWGGDAASDPHRPWRKDTVACLFSATKGVAAICVHMLLDGGVLELDAPVAQYWPEFARAGKSNVKVRWVLTHQAGLPLLDPDFSLDDVVAWDPVVRALEGQEPLWEPGTQHGYHAMTFGFLVGEIVKRVTGRSLGQFFADELAKPLGLRAWIGLPERSTPDLARLELADSDGDDLELLLAADPEGPIAQFVRMLTLGGAFPTKLVGGGKGDFNDRRVLAVELPAANMVSDARSLARIYAACVSDVEGVRLLSDAAAAACIPLQTSDTPVFGTALDAPRTLDFSLGFLKRPLLGDACFGHPGASGSLGFADLERRLAFGFVPRLMRPEGEDPRVPALLDAVSRVMT